VKADARPSFSLLETNRDQGDARVFSSSTCRQRPYLSLGPIVKAEDVRDWHDDPIPLHPPYGKCP
jgi:hypothetical protein